MISENGFSVVFAEQLEELPTYFSSDEEQYSEDGSMLWVKGTYESSVKEFNTSKEMFEWCYSNGWATPEENI